jgi:hypothetical protein
VHCGRDCPLRERCTKSKTGRNIVLHQRDDLLRKARRDWATDPGLREKYRKFRPNVERVISQLASRGGRRLKLRYRGTVKNNVVDTLVPRRTDAGATTGAYLALAAANRIVAPCSKSALADWWASTAGPAG